MRKVTLSFLAFFFSLAAWAQMPNMSFEDWDMGDSLYLQPAVDGDFYCSAYLSNLYGGTPNMTRVDGKSGHAIRVETASNSMLGYFVFGRTRSEDLAQDDDLYGGFPFYNQNVAKLTCDMRYDVSLNDSATVMVSFLYKDSVIAHTTHKFAGTQETFMPMSIWLQRPEMMPDKCIIAVTSEDTKNFGSAPGNYVEVDNMILEGENGEQYYVPDGDFEVWETARNMKCDGWEGYNHLPHDESFSPVEDDVVDGGYAIKIKTVQLPGEEPMGHMEIGSFTYNDIIPGMGLNGQVLDTFSFYYKYIPAEGKSDTALCVLGMTQYADSQRTIVGFNQSQLIPQSEWTKVSIPMEYHEGTMADSMAILFVASHEEEGVTTNKAQIGSTLYLDNIEMKMATPLADKNTTLKSSLAVSPNPSTGMVNLNPIEGETGFRLYDITGNEVYQTKVSKAQKVNLAEKPGMYFYMFMDKEGNVSRSGKLLLK